MLMVNAALERVYNTKRSPEEIDKIFASLREPFAVEFIKWKPQSTRSKQVNGRWVKEGQAAAYADVRAYTDRLNETVGPEGWFNFSEPVFSPQFEKVTKIYEKVTDPESGRTKSEPRETIVMKMKLICTVSMGILGIGFHTDVGEAWADDENAHTIAYAQALKRACYQFGLGRYLYDLPKQWIDLNDKGFFVNDPQLPDWALPPLKCVDGCGTTIVDGEHGTKTYTPDMILSETRRRFKKDLCFECWKKEERARLVAKKAADAEAAAQHPEAQAVADKVPGVQVGTANLPKANGRGLH